MEISDVKRRVVEAIERAKRQTAERRTRVDEASRAYDVFLDRTAVPLFKQVSNVLRAQGMIFTVFTPGASVRLMSDRASEDYIELTLDATGDVPVVTGHVSRARGRRILEAEHPIGPPDALTEEDVLAFVVRELALMIER